MSASTVIADQLCAELSLSGTAVLMARGTVASILAWRVGDLGPGAVELYPGDLDNRRRHMIETVDSRIDDWAAELLRACKRGRDYSRSLTVERLAEALRTLTA